MPITTTITRTTQTVTQTFETVHTTETTETPTPETGARPNVTLLLAAGTTLLSLGAGAVAYLVPSLANPAQVAFNVASLAAAALPYLHRHP
ncbi:hypothetical protein [Streptomyces sp. NBC_00158]|uniref:hypothetical protein n=1 Tax=Streptomyces sp. NBC_00158 TaxID=2903627 RepID=UPI002F91A4C9